MTLPLETRSRKFGNPLFIIAGAPRASADGIRNRFQVFYKKYCEIASAAFGSDDHGVYGRKAVEALFLDVAKRVLYKRQHESGSKKTSPSKIILFFAEGRDEEALLSQFNFFVHPIRVSLKNRNHINSVIDSYQNAFLAASNDPDCLAFVEDQVQFQYRRTPLLLPSKNFLHDKAIGAVENLFAKIMRGEWRWNQLGSEIDTRMFSSQDFPEFPIRKRKFVAHVDQRELVFPIPHEVEMHADDWDLPEDVWIKASSGRIEDRIRTQKSIQIKLNELYRFGIPIREGLHYDVQKQFNPQIRNIAFHCVKNGLRNPKDTHINVYPNDYVRV
jgi:hypothetical protein